MNHSLRTFPKKKERKLNLPITRSQPATRDNIHAYTRVHTVLQKVVKGLAKFLHDYDYIFKYDTEYSSPVVISIELCPFIPEFKTCEEKPPGGLTSWDSYYSTWEMQNEGLNLHFS